MHITLDVSDPSARPRLDDPDGFRSFDVRLAGAQAPPARRAALGRLGRVEDDDHVWVPLALVLELAGTRASDAGWRASLERMLDVARRHGWVDENTAIRAHVEPPGSP